MICHQSQIQWLFKTKFKTPDIRQLLCVISDKDLEHSAKALTLLMLYRMEFYSSSNKELSVLLMGAGAMAIAAGFTATAAGAIQPA